MHTFAPATGFSFTGLAPAVLNAIGRAGFTVPTPIQEKAIPVAMEGRDIIGLAETGTGKTMAFALPILNRLLVQRDERALIVVPTRELALQVEESIKKVSHVLQGAPRTVCLIGGMPIYRQIKDLKSQPRIIVATPGRLRDHLEQKTISLAQVSVLVLDEADRMLDMGFAPQIKFICTSLPTSRQTMLFSATFAPEVANLARSFQKEPVRIEVAKAGTSAKQIKQELCYVKHDGKFDLLLKLLSATPGTVLVFSRTKHGARKLNQSLLHAGYRSAEIHSNRSLGQRKEALNGFKNGKYRILVATDVASRGIDVQDIQLVINFDLPDAPSDYIHRIGRTGRAGKDGHAITFATPDQRRDVASIERLAGMKLPLSDLSTDIPASAPQSSYNRDFQRRPRPQHSGRSSYSSQGSSNRPRSFQPRQPKQRPQFRRSW